MLQTIRDHMQGWIAGIIISVLTIIVALWGISSYFAAGVNHEAIATVNGTDISREKFTVAYEQARRQIHTQLGVSLPLPSSKELIIKEQVLQNLIETEVLQQSARANNYRIAQDQVHDYLTNIPDFQKNGKFSLSTFQEVMSASLYSALDLLDLIETNLLITQPKVGISVSSFALPHEVQEMIALMMQERHLSYLFIDQTELKNHLPELKPDAIMDYYKNNQAEFKTPEQVKIEYLQLSLPDIMRNIKPEVGAVKNYYNENIKNFVTVKVINNKKVTYVEPLAKIYPKVRDMLIRQQAEEVMYNLRDKLADLTYEHPNSLEPAARALDLQLKTSTLFTKDKGGTSIAALPKVRAAAFSVEVLNLHNNSDLLQINAENIVVLRIKQHLPSTLLPLKIVAKQIQARLKSQLLSKNLADYAQKIYTELNTQTKSATEISQQYHLSWHDVNFVGRYSNKLTNAILDCAFQLSDPKFNDHKINYGFVALPRGYAIVAVHEVRNSNIISKNQRDLFNKRLRASNAMMEYELYKRSLVHHTKIVLSP